MKRTILIIIITLISTVSGVAYRFTFEDSKKLSFIEETVLGQKIYRNNKLYKTINIKTILDAIQIRTEDSKTIYAGAITFFKGNKKKQFKKKSSRMISFSRDRQGRVAMRRGMNFLPRQNFPHFPSKSIRLEKSWTAPLVEMFNLYPLGMKDRFQLKTTVTYRYVRDQVLDGHKVAVILYYYNLDTTQAPSKICSSVKGMVTGLIFWNKDENQPLRISESFNITFNFAKAKPIRCDGLADKSIYFVTEKSKRRLDFRKELNKSLGKGQDTRITKDGVVLDLGNILFKPGKTVIELDGINKLIKIAEFLKKRKKIKARIEGHTDNKGNKNYNLRLSRNRARTVYRFFTNQIGIPRYRLRSKGWGHQKPIASNMTETGRSKNRRVEIIFLIN